MSKQGAQRGVGKGSGRALSVEAARSLLAERLRERLPELKAAIATRVYAISDPRDVSDPAYGQSLDAALAAAVEYRLEVLEVGERRAPDVPAALLAQARLDARDRVPVDTTLRRYFAGNALFADFLAEEAERAEIPNAVLRRLLAAQATVGDRLLAAVSAEHAREVKAHPTSLAERQRETVKKLLAGELVDYSEIDYDFDGHHLGLMAMGPGGGDVLRELGKRLDRRQIAGKREEEPIWGGWLCGREPITAEAAVEALEAIVPDGVFVTVGEPARGLAGWRFSHLQAKAALQVAARKGQPIVRYVEVAFEAAALRDDLLAGSLRQLYLDPLEGMRDGGRVARETLRAYFAAERNVSSTAAALGVDRRTVRNRIRAIEDLLGRPLSVAAADLEIALRLAEPPFPD